MTAEHVADGEVAMGVLHLGNVHGLVDLQPAAGEGRDAGAITTHALVGPAGRGPAERLERVVGG